MGLDAVLNVTVLLLTPPLVDTCLVQSAGGAEDSTFEFVAMLTEYTGEPPNGLVMVSVNDLPFDLTFTAGFEAASAGATSNSTSAIDDTSTAMQKADLASTQLPHAPAIYKMSPEEFT
jgi:hypothetical protein